MSEDKLSDFLDIKPIEESVSTEIAVPEVKSIKRQKKDLVSQDFNEARLNMKDLIQTGFNAIDGMMKVA